MGIEETTDRKRLELFGGDDCDAFRGEVGAPGQYTYVPGMTVQNAIAIAGGYSARAEQKDADVTRQINGKVMTGRVPITDPILPGDTIYLRERLF